MARILGTVISLALIFSPQLALSSPTKKKSGTSSKLVKKTKNTPAKSSSRSRYKKSRKSKRSYTRDYDRIAPGAEAVSRASVTGVGETPPLMRVIPQRDGRFLLEPLTPKKEMRQLTGPTSKLDPKKAGPPRNQGYNKFEPWNFQDLILTRAKTYCGTPYAMGASLAYSSATDCSGFVQYIYEGFKIELPRSSAEQAEVGRFVTHNMDFSKLVPGDLLFFRRRGRHVGHAGIYLGEGKMIHASSSRSGGVIITDLREPYYQNTFVVAKRVFEIKYPDW